ncbi:MAG: flagellar hook-basal body complex protein [Clostridia bacterium]|nr:flagellar hook-basal body complex protein [Clostridia bacterium]NCC68684.1 flagellar hook-basal body complex protein [Clostridia bacterium]
MMRSLFSAVSGLKNSQTAMDVIGNNVANVNTIGYKTSRTIFQDIYSQTISTATAATDSSGGSNAKQVGLGVSISEVSLNMTEGSTQSTSNPLDFSISGEGFFVVDSGDGSYVYTRNGALSLDSEGYLVTANGNYVMGLTGDETAVANGASLYDTATTPATPLFGKVQITGEVDTGTTDPVTGDPIYETYSDYAIDSNGTITAMDSSGNTVTLGRLVLATFNNTAGLEKVGASSYSASANSGDAVVEFVNDGCGYLNSGSLEMSNVDLATELTSMIITQRAFQANSRVITTSDTMLEELINLKR